MTYDEFLNFLDQFEEIKSFAGRIKAADQTLQRIGSGSGRIVYDIDGTKVFKVAKNAKGVAQNDAEADAGRYPDTHNIVTKVFEEANNGEWLISEKGKKVNEKRIKELTGIPSLNELYYFLRNYYEQNRGKRPVFGQEPEVVEQLTENEWVQELDNFIANYNQSPGDMGRPSTYGEVIRDGQPTIVLTDYGLNDEVYDTHYSPKIKQQYRMYELYDFADGNDDMLSDAGGGQDIRTGIWAQVPYGVGDGDGVINEKHIEFVSNREYYPSKPLETMPYLMEIFHECVNNLKEGISCAKDPKKFYNNLLKLQEYLIEQKFYDREPLGKEEYAINETEEIPPQQSADGTPSVKASRLSLNQEYAQELANAITKKLGLGQPNLLGGAGYGFAYDIGNDVVMKITTDISEADSGFKIMRNHPKTLADVYKIYKVVDTEKNLAFYVLLEENIKDKPLDKFRRYEQLMNVLEPNGMTLADFTSAIRLPKRFDYNAMVEIAKQVLTIKPEANINEQERKELYDYLIGILNIRKDLIDFNIKSTDYITIGNLGYKNGILTYFDVGGYVAEEPPINKDNIIYLPEGEEVLDENYDVNVANKIADQVAVKMNLGKPKLMGAGMFGVAYDIGNDRVLKITKDKSEATENLRLIGKPLKYIAEPYSVFEIKSKSDTTIPITYGIVLEKLETNPEIIRQKERLDYVFNKILGVGLPDVIEYYLGEWDDGRVNKDKINSYLKKNPRDAEFFGGLVRIAEEAKAYGVESMDYLNAENLGYKKNGALAFFDVGFGNYFLEPEGAGKIEVAEDSTSKFSQTDSIGRDDFPPYEQNDSSPVADNNIPVNIEERDKSFMPKSSVVSVKKKCRLGGLGHTSIACNQGDISNLDIKPLKEEVNTQDEIKFSNDEILNRFLNRLNKKTPLSRNPFMPREFVYGDKGSLEFSRFNKHDRNEIELQDIMAFEKAKGIGSSIMQDIIDVADELGIKLTLTAKPFGTDPKSLKKKDLINFYKKFGFVTDMDSFGGEFETEDELLDYVLQYPDEGLEMYREPHTHTLHEEIHASEAYDDKGSVETVLSGKRNVGYPTISPEKAEELRQKGLNVMPVFPEGSDIRKQYYDHMSTEGGWGEHGAKHLVDTAYLIYRDEGKEDAMKLYDYIKSHGGFVSDKNPEEARTVGKLLGYDDASIEEYIQRKYGKKVPMEKTVADYAEMDEAAESSQKYYRAVDKFGGKTVEFEPQGFYEAIDDDGNPIFKYDTHWISDKPETAASYSVGGAVMGLYSMFRQHGKTPKVFYIYEINEKPDVDISHWDMGDFAHLQEVRYRRPVKGTYKGRVTITDDIKQKLDAYYEIVSSDEYEQPIYDPEYEKAQRIFQDTDYDQYLANVKNMVAENHIPHNKDYWGWVSPDNRLVQVPKLKHMGYIMTQYKNEPFGWDAERVFNKAFEDGWVRITYEYFPQEFRGDLNINGYNKERVVEIFKKFFYNMMKYGYNTIYLEWENPTKEHLRFNTRDSEGKMKLVNYIDEANIALPKNSVKRDVERRGGKIYSVGGAVRDEFLGKESKDLDLLITGIPMDELEQLLSKYGRVDAVGKSFGVLKFKPRGWTEDIDVAIPRTEKPTAAGGHKGFDVTSDHALPIEKDLERRDFTINAIAKDGEGNIVDPFGGREDLKNKIIRVVNPEAFSDDPLRMLRAVQFASRFNFTIEPQTMKMIQDNAEKIKTISPERILTEFDKIIKKGNPAIGVKLLSDTGLFIHIFGNDIKPSRIARRNFYGVRTMGEFIFLMTSGVVKNPAEFYKNQLKGDINTYKEIKALEVAFDIYLLDEDMTPVKARAVAHNMYVTSPATFESEILPNVIEKAVEELKSGKYPKTIGELAVNGNDLMALGLKGKEVGDALKMMLLKIYSDNVDNNKEELLSLLPAKNAIDEYSYDTLSQNNKYTWNVDGNEVDIHFFLDKYDEWNQGERFRDPSKESILRFLEDEFPELVDDEKLKREINWELNLRDLLNEDVQMKNVAYSAVVLDEKSHNKLVKVFSLMIPEDWEIIAHHMTIQMGALIDKTNVGKEVRLSVIDYAIDDKVMAVGVEGYLTTNKKPHVTIAVNRKEGGKPVMSNNLTDWKPLGFPLQLTGIVTEVSR